MNSERPTTRVQLELPGPSMERLQRLKQTLEASSHAEVIRKALRLLDYMVEKVDANGCVEVVHQDVREKVLLK